MSKPSFPDEIEFRGLNTPIRTESSVRNLAVEGVIPADIRGAFFRSVPDPAHPPMTAGHTLLSADGMVAKFLFTEGPDGTTAVDHDLRYVQTARYQAEQKARRSLFGRYRNPFTDDPAAAGVDRTVANTTPVFHGGYLLATKEDGRPYRVNPHTLETYGSWDYAGKLKSETMTAHVRVDPVTGEMFSFGYEATGLCSKTMSYFIVDKDGQLQSEQFFDAPYCGMVHDMGLTERHVVFPVFPTTADLDRLKAGGPHWVHEQNTPCWVGIMPRYGKVEEMRWFTWISAGRTRTVSRSSVKTAAFTSRCRKFRAAYYAGASTLPTRHPTSLCVALGLRATCRVSPMPTMAVLTPVAGTSPWTRRPARPFRPAL